MTPIKSALEEAARAMHNSVEGDMYDTWAPGSIHRAAIDQQARACISAFLKALEPTEGMIGSGDLAIAKAGPHAPISEAVFTAMRDSLLTDLEKN